MSVKTGTNRTKSDSNFKFTEGFIQEALNHFFAFGSVKYNIDGLYVFDWESDKLLETKSGYIYEFEIKVSKADFKNDFKHKKDKHIILEGGERYGDKYLPEYYELLEESKRRGAWAEQSFHKWADNSERYLVNGHKRPNYFYYAVPTDLIPVEDIPEYAGLVYVDERGNLTIKKNAPKLHSEKYTDMQLNFGEKFYYNMDNWRRKCKTALRESDDWRKKFLSEVDSQGHGMGYTEMEAMLESYKKTCENLEEQRRKSSEQLHRDLYRQNTMVRMLARELQKCKPDFNLFAFEEEKFGKLD